MQKKERWEKERKKEGLRGEKREKQEDNLFAKWDVGYLFMVMRLTRADSKFGGQKRGRRSVM